jgi:hypothetical protein
MAFCEGHLPFAQPVVLMASSVRMQAPSGGFRSFCSGLTALNGARTELEDVNLINPQRGGGIK